MSATHSGTKNFWGKVIQNHSQSGSAAGVSTTTELKTSAAKSCSKGEKASIRGGTQVWRVD